MPAVGTLGGEEESLLASPDKVGDRCLRTLVFKSQLPRDQLRSLKWCCHEWPMRMKTLASIAMQHRYLEELVITNLRVRRCARNRWLCSEPLVLRSFQLDAVDHVCDLGTTAAAAGKYKVPSTDPCFIPFRRGSLRHLRIGEDMAIMQDSIESASIRSSLATYDVRAVEASYRQQQFFPQRAGEEQMEQLCLHSLEVVHVSLDVLVGPGRMYQWREVIAWPMLRRLRIESCQFSYQLLQKLTVLTSEGSLCLKEFVFRAEECSVDLREALQHFLCSFSGLNLVSVLLRPLSPFALEPVARCHGSTLRVLIWEMSLRRTSYTSDCYQEILNGFDPEQPDENPFTLVELAHICPNLEELSLSFPHGDRMSWHTRRGPFACTLANKLRGFRNLHTLHIRNHGVLRPQDCRDRKQSELEQRLSDEMHAFVTDFTAALTVLSLQAQRPAVKGDLGKGHSLQTRGQSTRLTTLIIGPFLLSYQNKIVSESTVGHHLFYRPVFFSVQRLHPDTWGNDDLIPGELGVGEDALDRARDHTPHLRCTESYWLN